MRVADLAECYDKHAEALLRFAASQVGWSDAEDVLSAAVLGVLGAADRPGRAPVDDLRAYLYRAVANTAANHWRSLDRRSRRERAFATPEAIEAVEANPDVVNALAGLSPQQRAVVHLTYWEDLTPAVVAERLGVSDGTVRRQLARARARLKEALS